VKASIRVAVVWWGKLLKIFYYWVSVTCRKTLNSSAVIYCVFYTAELHNLFEG